MLLFAVFVGLLVVWAVVRKLFGIGPGLRRDVFGGVRHYGKMHVDDLRNQLEQADSVGGFALGYWRWVSGLIALVVILAFAFGAVPLAS